MSTSNNVVPQVGFTPISDSSNTTRYQVSRDYGNGRVVNVGLRVSNEGAPDADAQRTAFLETVYPPSLTEGLEREIADFTRRLGEVYGDRDGKLQQRVQGRDREVMEMKLQNRRSALVAARQDRVIAERIQQQRRVEQMEKNQRIEASAQQRAIELEEGAQIERRARQLAARKGA
ncbi:hypothetical protein [Pseudoxanthomonas mexicana]|uniref:hypothetical protein n=1 Tax=Pseudoxanthomonas mexicana TaxID=128785 RepID=UPI0028AA88B4|nr:hypothetical protein [Pseudoxanthomonas mexicana]